MVAQAVRNSSPREHPRCSFGGHHGGIHPADEQDTGGSETSARVALLSGQGYIYLHRPFYELEPPSRPEWGYQRPPAASSTTPLHSSRRSPLLKGPSTPTDSSGLVRLPPLGTG